LGTASALLFVPAFILVIVDLYSAADDAPWEQRQVVIIAMMCLSFLGMALGIAGLGDLGRKKFYALLGTLFNLLVLGWAIMLYVMVHR
jgi:hypothetical protein